MALSALVSDFVNVYGLNKTFFASQAQKARIWIPEAQKIMKRIICEQNFAVVAPTGGGKTVMGQLAPVQLSRRCLFIVPMRRLAKRHQKLFEAIGSKIHTRVITGETPIKKRIWDDPNERVIFTTGHVVLEELKKNQELLNNFGFVVFDEFHNAATKRHCYSRVAQTAQAHRITRVGLSASPGNNKDKVRAAMQNCGLDKIHYVSVPVSRQMASLIYMEEAPAYQRGPHQYIVELIVNEMTRCAYIFNYQAKARLGVSAGLDPGKHNGYKAIKRFRDGILRFLPNKAEGENYNLFEDKAAAGQLLSTLREYEVWAHVYDLVHNESYAAFQNYYDQTIKRSSANYALRMVKRGRMLQILEMIGQAVHPKMQQLTLILESLERRGMQAINFVANKATAQACHQHVSAANIASATMLGGNSMTAAQQELALELIEDKQVRVLHATTVVREGFDLSVDCIINYNPPKSSIDLIQRSGRAGRHEQPAEIIYLATRNERRIIRSTDRNVRRMKLAEFSQFSGPPLPLEFDAEEVFPDDLSLEPPAEGAATALAAVMHQQSLF